ncbi:Glutamate-gated chloride channel-like 1 [Homarus americanus]|uniref:Glutamate-gated chloride channel-like 1 n=1 Tax=Homarus americanus TaxID=6706 RepID=A0A8J5JTI2_HOMAM|nr:Glutamate-gated chloride channel-like 1 [Homarus americanus]
MFTDKTKRKVEACKWPGEEVQVFSLQPDIWKSPTDDVYIRFNMSNQQVAASVTEFTICSRVYQTALQPLQVFLSYATADTFDNALMMYIRDKHHFFRYNNKPQTPIESLDLPTVIREWRYYCHVFSDDTYTVYVDGVLLASGAIQVDDRVLFLNGTLVIGQEQDGLSRGYNRHQIIQGYVTQVNMWSYGLSAADIESTADCRSNILGDIMSSDRDQFELLNVDTVSTDLQDLCSNDDNVVAFPERRCFLEAVKMCHLIGSELYAPLTLLKNSELHNVMVTEGFCPGAQNMWVGVTDEEEEGVWRRLSDDKIVTEINFSQGQPDNLRSENCMMMVNNKGQWADYNCLYTNPACAACEVGRRMPLYLRGLCKEMKTETMFEVLGYTNNKPFFHGYHGIIIKYDDDNKWVMLDTDTNTTLASLTVATNKYPLGRHRWTLLASVCDEPVGAVLQVSLSICKDGEYMCDDGECISLAARCDAKDDCGDETDEDNCSILQIPAGYRSFKPPKNTDDPTQPLHPILKLKFLRFLMIEDVQETIHLEFILDISWTDSRLKYQNLRSEMLANQMSVQEVSDIWRPHLQFPNIKDGALKLLKEDLFVLRVKEPLPADFNKVKMDEMYGGDAARVVQRQHYSGIFVCAFDVFYYPFDVQQCSVQMQLASVSKELVAFTTERSVAEYTQDLSLSRYYVSDFFTKVPSNHIRETLIEVGYTLTRRFTLIVLSIYLPSLMLLAIGYSTLYVKVQMLEVRLVVSLTTLLVLYTFFNQTSSSLPQTAYVKMIDVWFFFCTILLFVIIIVHVFVERMGQGDSIIRVVPASKGSSSRRLARVRRCHVSAETLLMALRTFVGPFVSRSHSTPIPGRSPGLTPIPPAGLQVSQTASPGTQVWHTHPPAGLQVSQGTPIPPAGLQVSQSTPIPPAGLQVSQAKYMGATPSLHVTPSTMTWARIVPPGNTVCLKQQHTCRMALY